MNEQDYQKHIEWLEEIINGLVGILDNIKDRVPDPDRPLIQEVINKANARYSTPQPAQEK